MCQEVGHTFGLDHQDENFDNAPLGTCMDYSNDPVPNQHPNTHDYNELVTIYSHLDSTTTVGNQLAGTSRAELDTPDQWGKSVKRSAKGHQEVFERDFGGGQKVVTFVIWA